MHGNELILMNCKLDQKGTSKFWLSTHPRCALLLLIERLRCVQVPSYGCTCLVPSHSRLLFLTPGCPLFVATKTNLRQRGTPGAIGQMPRRA